MMIETKEMRMTLMRLKRSSSSALLMLEKMENDDDRHREDEYKECSAVIDKPKQDEIPSSLISMSSININSIRKALIKMMIQKYISPIHVIISISIII